MSANPASVIPRLWRKVSEPSENGSYLDLSFHPGQLDAWNATERFICVLAGSQGGKTSWCPWWLAREIQGTADPDGILNDYIAITSTYSLFRNKFLPSLLEVFEGALGTGRYWASSNIIELADPRDGKFWAKRQSGAMWGRILLASASSPSGIESATARGALADEAGQSEYTAKVFDALERRLQLAEGRLCLPTTPYDLGELKTRYHDPAKRRGTPHEQKGDEQYALIQFDNKLNPAYPLEEYERQRRILPAWKFEMFCRGRFTRPAGQILGCWRGWSESEPNDKGERGHEKAPATYPARCFRIVPLDFGGAHTAAGLAVLEEGEDGFPTGRIIVTRTYQGASGHAPDHVRGIVNLLNASVEPTDPGNIAQSGSHGAFVALAVGGAASEDQWRQGYYSAGLPVLGPIIPDVETGIDRMYGIIATDKLIVHSTERGGDPAQGGGLIDQIEGYSRETDDAGEPTQKIKNKNRFHKLDTLRYLSCLLAPWAGTAARFLPFEFRRHWVLQPKVFPWYNRVASLVWREGEQSAFVVLTVSESGQCTVFSEETSAPGESATAFANRCARKLHNLGTPLDLDTQKFRIAITANPELFVSASRQGINAPPLAETFRRARLPITPAARADGESEWATLRSKLEGTLNPAVSSLSPAQLEARRRGEILPQVPQLVVYRYGAPMCALTLALLQADPNEPDQPHKRCPAVWAQAIAQALRLRPAAATRPPEGPLEQAYNPLAATPQPMREIR